VYVCVCVCVHVCVCVCVFTVECVYRVCFRWDRVCLLL